MIKLLPQAVERQIFILTHTKMTALRWLHNTTNTTEDCWCSPGWRNYPVDRVICYSNSWLCCLLSSNFATIQLGPDYHFRNYSLNVLPVGLSPHLLQELLLHKPLSSFFCFLLLFAKCNDFLGWAISFFNSLKGGSSLASGAKSVGLFKQNCRISSQFNMEMRQTCLIYQRNRNFQYY